MTQHHLIRNQMKQIKQLQERVHKLQKENDALKMAHHTGVDHRLIREGRKDARTRIAKRAYVGDGRS